MTKKQESQESQESKKILDRIARYILSRTHRQLGNLTVEGLAKEMNLSRAYLHQLFNNQPMMSPDQFITAAKLSRAAILLTENQTRTVQTISRLLGFGTMEDFNHLFRMHYGTTPLDFRRQILIKKAGGNPPTPDHYDKTNDGDSRFIHIETLPQQLRGLLRRQIRRRRIAN
ncbi:MAG: AraC family transcriptional regulator [bacterium]|nr:AraC family transcriptional regulator [bacterium]